MEKNRPETPEIFDQSDTWTISRNLTDAGCNQEMIQKFMELREKEEQLYFLSKQRKLLLNRVHQEEQKISCLDYLVYKIQKEEPQKEQEEHHDTL